MNEGAQWDADPALRGKFEARVCLSSALFFRRERPARSHVKRDAGDKANGGNSGDDPVPIYFQISHHRTSNRPSALWTDGIANFP
jgi:hypothetical protein